MWGTRARAAIPGLAINIRAAKLFYSVSEPKLAKPRAQT
jgi:hypothetical protein